MALKCVGNLAIVSSRARIHMLAIVVQRGGSDAGVAVSLDGLAWSFPGEVVVSASSFATLFGGSSVDPLP